MKKTSTLVLTCLYLLATNRNHAYDIPQLPQPSSTISNAVLKRLYGIARLEKICAHFFTIPHAQQNFLPLVTALMAVIKHDHIRSALARAHETATMQPLHKLWQEICAYRFLDDELFIEEFSRVLYALLAHTKDGPATPSSLSVVEKEIDALAIARRFYLIQRLRHAITTCCAAHDKADPALAVTLALWDDIQQYKNIDTLNSSFGICLSVIALLESEGHNPSLDHPLATDHEALEKLLASIDALADRYQNAEKGETSNRSPFMVY